MSKPLLSIGIIFKNEIRCLERCLKSLQPLRDAIPCELVMADTGSDDGSREVAERYADILFDFPWVNDFAAARNAVMARCSGKWYLTVDADEWLDEDFSQLTKFLSESHPKIGGCSLIQRNYSAFDSQEKYSDFLAVRMARMSTGERYHGAIHEVLRLPPEVVFVLSKTVLHHDGYVGLGGKQGEGKRKRNMELLRVELEKNPNDVRIRVLCMESSSGDPDHEHYVRLALEGLKQKMPGWQSFGPVILRNAVNWAIKDAKEEMDGFAEDARTMFPNSIITRLDVEYQICTTYFNGQNYERALPAGEAYLRGIADYHAGRCDLSDMMFSTLQSTAPMRESHVGLIVAESYFQTGEFQKAMERLTAVELEKLHEADFKTYVGIMLNLQAQSGQELSGQLLKLWDYVEALDEKDPARKQWMDALSTAGGKVFPPHYRDGEAKKGFRHAYTLFLPLVGKSEMGTAARVLEAADTKEMETLLGDVRNWKKFPIHVLAHAIKRGARFPLPDRPMNIENMDALATRLAQNTGSLYLLVEQSMERGLPDNIQEFIWVRGLVLAGVRKFAWGGENADAEQGMALMYAFAEVERKYLPLCYAQETLREETLFLFPPVHRFGFYCARAFDALAQGDAAEYVRLLRAGLTVCETANGMVEFLLEHTPELHAPEPSAELQALAEQIRAVLANFAPDDPAVAALKQSEAYQKVAYLIEGASVPVVGGLLQ